MRFGNKDLARYPFLREALSYVTKNEFKIEDLDNSEFYHLVEKAKRKIFRVVITEVFHRRGRESECAN